jgi:hypothetical protein
VARPDAEPELTLLASMFDSVGGPALSVFGHADPVGDDEYNKALSGRRARAIYALFTRDTAIWSELAGAEAWPPAAFAMMQDRTALPAGTPRDALFRAYMDAICHRADGTPFAVDRTGFLGRGADPGGKADVQGCRPRNPQRACASPCGRRRTWSATSASPVARASATRSHSSPPSSTTTI